MYRVLLSFPFIVGVATGWWIGLGNGGIVLIFASILERFLYIQRLGDGVETGGEAGPLGQLHFLCVLAYSSMLIWALFPWSLIPEGMIPSEWLPQVESPFTTNWFDVFDVDDAPLENPLKRDDFSE